MSGADPNPPLVSGIVLAAGSSRRMGQPKQLLEYLGKPLLSHAIEAARGSGLAEVVVVLGRHADEIIAALSLAELPGLRVVLNDDWASGQASSLRCGLLALDPTAAAAAILLGDQPGVSSATIDLVLSSFASIDVSRTPMLRPVYTGGGQRVPGHPVVIARSLWPQIKALDGDQGARAVIAAQPETLVTLDLNSEAPVDIDTPADYRRVVAKRDG